MIISASKFGASIHCVGRSIRRCGPAILVALFSLNSGSTFGAAPTAEPSRESGDLQGSVSSCAGTNEDYLVYIPGTSFSAYTDPAGQFKISYVQPGRYTVVISKSGERRAAVSNIDILKKQLTVISTIEICLDLDGDGFDQLADCNDSNPNINPGVPEQCGDGIDNNCDATIDEGCIICTDNDSDGFFAQPGCGSLVLDCDDTDASINPDAIEICDGIDNNCDTLTDEPGSGGELTWYRDADSDGFGDPNTVLNSCGPVAGYVTNGSDCNDLDSSINPNATEIGGDGIDQNCNGIADETPLISEFLDAHNTVRQNATPPPVSALPPMQWDATIAATAQSWADTCPDSHNPNIGQLGLGENMVFGNVTPATAVSLWAAEGANYDYNAHTCGDQDIISCGHYLQLVYRDTTLVGCGIASNCPNGGRIVCNYSLPANIFVRPY